MQGMSIFSAATRSRTSCAILPILNSTSTAGRAYATADRSGGDKIKAANFKNKQERKVKAGKNSATYPDGKREIRSGAFRAMPNHHLTEEVLMDSRGDVKLPKFTPESLRRNPVGKAMEFPVNETDAFRKFGLPTNLLLEFRLLSQPTTVIRDITLKAIESLEQARAHSSLETRYVFTGAPGCGKSTLLLQVVEYCVAKKWLVLYIPRGIQLVDSSSAYAYDPRTRLYHQPVFAYRTLQRFLTVNSAILQSLQTTADIMIDRKPTILSHTPMVDLINIGLKDQTVAPAVLSSLLAELGKQTKHPVLLAVDDFQALYCKTAYRDPHFNRLSPYHLSMPRLIMEYANGTREFARGAVFGAISCSNTSYQVPLELREALHLPWDRPTGPYHHRAQSLRKFAQGLRAMPVPDQLSVSEAASIFELWIQNKSFISLKNDETFLAKYTEASGNARDFVWKGLFSSLES